MANFTGESIKSTYQRVLQIDTGSIQDGLGNSVNIPVTQVTGATLVSSSVQLASDISGAFHHSASNLNSRMGQTEINTQNNQNAIIRLTALTSSYAFAASITGSFNESSASLASAVSDLNAATSSYAILTGANVFTGSQKFKNNIEVTGSSLFNNSVEFKSLVVVQSDINFDTAGDPGTGRQVAMYLDSDGGSTSIYGGFQVIDMNGSDGGLELNSYTGLDDNKPVFVIRGGNSGSYSHNRIVEGYENGKLHFPRSVDFQDTLIFSQSINSLGIITGSFSGSFEGVALSKDTGSYALKTQISGSFNELSSSIATRFDNITHSDVSALNAATGSYALKTQITGSFNTLSASLASRITNNDTDITNRQLIVTSSSPVQNTYIIPVQVDCTPSGTTFLTGSYETASILRLNYTGGNGTHTLTLPDATTTTNTYRSIRVISNGTIDNQHQVDLFPSASQTLDGVSSGFSFNRSYEGVMVWSDGTEWFKIQAKNV